MLLDLGNLPGHPNLTVGNSNAVNSSGMVVGQFRDAEGLGRRAFVWTEQQGMVEPIGFWGQADCVNAVGVVGGMGNRGSGLEGYLWQSGVTQWLPLTAISGINDLGYAVGRGISGSGTGYIVYENMLTAIDSLLVPNTGWHVNSGVKIANDMRMIAGGQHKTSGEFAWLYLTPVPEMGGLEALTLAMLVFTLTRLRRRTQMR
jgi:hypothetical protein